MHHDEQKRLDREAMRYLAALDAGDFDTLAALWNAAETDEALAEVASGLAKSGYGAYLLGLLER